MMDIIGNVRIVEDSVAAVLLTLAMAALLRAVWRLQGVPIRFMPAAILVGLVPLYLWKALGCFRRVWIDKGSNPDLYAVLHDLGEVFEGLSGLMFAASIAYILFRLHRLAVAR